MSPNRIPVPFASSADVIPTAGEIFADGAVIELIGASDSDRPNLLLSTANTVVTGRQLRHGDRTFEPITLPRSIRDRLFLPTHASGYSSTRELLDEVCKLAHRYSLLSDNCVSIVGRFVLSTCLADALQTAPTLILNGPDRSAADHLLTFLQSVCRRPLLMTAVTPGGLCSLPGNLNFTLLLHQPVISPQLEQVLVSATLRDHGIPKRGQLLNLYGCQAVSCDSMTTSSAWPCGICVPSVPSSRQLPPLERDSLRRIAEEIQPKLLSFRLAKLAEAQKMMFDASAFPRPLRELAHAFAAATSDDFELQGRLPSLLRDEITAIRAAAWVDPKVAVIEALIAHRREKGDQLVYVGGIAEMAEKILELRLDSRELDAGQVGKWLKEFDVPTEPRNSRGVAVRISNEIYRRILDLARQMEVPSLQEFKLKDDER